MFYVTLRPAFIVLSFAVSVARMTCVAGGISCAKIDLFSPRARQEKHVNHSN